METSAMAAENLSIGYKSRIPTEGIMYLKGDGNYTVIHMVHHRTFISSKTLQVLQNRLQGGAFLRINKGVLLNLLFIKSHRHFSANHLEIEIVDGQRFPVARRRIKACMAFLRV